MPDNYVDITVRAQDKAAEFDLQVLKNRLNELGRMVETAKVNLAGDKEAQVTLARLDAKLLGWGRRVETAHLKVDGVARAEADLAAMSLSLDNLGTGAASSGSSLAALGPVLIGVGVAAAGVAAVALAPLAAALALVGAGAVGLAAVAVPELTKIWTAVSKGGKAWKDLSGPEKEVGNQIKGLKDGFDSIAKAVRPNILHMFSEALKVIRDLMPVLRPLIKAAADALAGFFKNIDEWLRSASGKKFLNWMKTEGPQDIANFGHFMWSFARDTGSAFAHIVSVGRGLDRFFTQTIPAAFQLAVDEVIRTWDLLVIGAISTVLHISNAFGLLPGPLGAPFRKASAAIQASLNQMEANVRAATARIQADINRLHGKTIQILTVYTQHGFPGGVGPGSTGVGVAPPPSGGTLSGTLAASVLGAPTGGGTADRPFMAPAPYYGQRHITNQLIPSGHWPQHTTISNGAELIGVLAALLSQYARTHHGGSAQQAYGYGPG